MAYTRPYVKDRFTAYEGDSITMGLTFAIQLIDEYIFLFSWGDILNKEDGTSGKHLGKFMEFLKRKFDINWKIDEVIITEIDDTTIKASANNNFLLLRLNNDITKAILTIDDGRTDKFTVRIENDKKKIYDYSRKAPIGPIKVTIKEGNLKAVKNPSGFFIFVHKVYNFITDPIEGTYTVRIESDFYFPEERTVDTSKIKIDDVILEFDNNGPAHGATSIILKDVSKLQKDDIIKFHNPGGEMEQMIIENIGNHTIFWTGGLEHDFNESGSTVLALKNPVVTIAVTPRPSYPYLNNATLVRGLVVSNTGSNTDPVVNAEVNVLNRIEQTKTDEKGEFALCFKEIKKNEDITIEIKKNENSKTIDSTLEEGKTISLGKIHIP